MTSILKFCQGLPTARFAPGDVLLAEGDRSGKLYLLIDGELVILKGDYQINTVPDPGGIVGEILALHDLPHMATAKATTS
jgi:CRP/FNR family transcriptional regulator, cyclic AMP receptor protein